MSADDSELSAIRHAALYFLTRREHAYAELRNKLKCKFNDLTAIEVVLDELVEQNWQSDERFADMFAKVRLNQGYGPLRVQNELQSKQVKESLIMSALQEHRSQSIKWLLQCWKKKYRGQLPSDAKEKQKQMRFLLYRGFTSEAVNSLFRKLESGELLNEGYEDEKMV